MRGCDLSDKEFQIMVTKIFIEVKRTVNEWSENFNKEPENIKVPNRNRRTKRHINHNWTKKFNNRGARHQSRSSERTKQTSRQGDEIHLIRGINRKKNEKEYSCLRLMGYLQVDQYLHYRGSRRRSERGTESIFRGIKAQNIHNMDKETDIQIQENL